jgi:2-alkenal reductase
MIRSYRHILIAITLLLISTMACSLFSQVETLAVPDTTEKQPTPSLLTTSLPAQNPAAVDLVDQQERFVSLYQAVNPGVVTIRTLTEQGDGLGSGFVIDGEGHIVTNYHVVRGATDFEVDFPSGFKTRGEILGTDLDSDIAVLKIDSLPDPLVPLALGDSDAVKVGQIVIAIGNPLGHESTMTTGIVSSIGRTMQSMHEAPGGGTFTAGDIIQTDAAINPGNSGGPLLNLNGEVIGVNVAIETTSFDMLGQPINSGIGFAISINMVKRVVPALISQGFYEYPYIGIRTLSEINLFQQETLGLSRSSGVYILEVTPGSPAEKAGLIAGSEPTDNPGLFAGGDLIIAVDGVPVQDFNEMITFLTTNKSPGDTVVMRILRGDQELEIPLTLSDRP